MLGHLQRTLLGVLIAGGLFSSTAAAAEGGDKEVEKLRKLVEQLIERDKEREKTIVKLQNTVEQLKQGKGVVGSEVGSELDRALARIEPGSSTVVRDYTQSGLQRTGAAPEKYIDISANLITSVGTSTEDEDTIQSLQGGGHDPKKRGFTLQQLELSFSGAVDPYLRGEAHIVYFIDALTGGSVVELEEAFATADNLPLNMELEVGHFLTEFGRLNPTHADAWAWQDAPIINTRLFGPDGMRGPGIRFGWMLPTPWYSQIHLGAQNANGETMSSFLGEQPGSAFGHSHGGEEGGHAHSRQGDDHDDDHGDEHALEAAAFEEGIGGSPILTRRVKSFSDLAYLARWENSWDFNEELTGLLGVSSLFGPNSTGHDGHTWIGGVDWTMKWRPNRTQRGYPFLLWQSEFAFRRFKADRYMFIDEEDGGLVMLNPRVLKDWGLYSQVLWGFKQNWAVGLRFEYAHSIEENVELEHDEGFVEHDRASDPMRNERWRISPMLEWSPSEFSRVRFQYNFDHAEHLDDKGAHSIWLGLQILWGSHPPHKY